MRKDGVYLYTLRFPRTPEAFRAGEFLESLGHSKSKIIISAILEYMDNHPEVTGDYKGNSYDSPTAAKCQSYISDQESVQRSAPAAPASASVNPAPMAVTPEMMMQMFQQMMATGQANPNVMPSPQRSNFVADTAASEKYGTDDEEDELDAGSDAMLSIWQNMTSKK